MASVIEIVDSYPFKMVDFYPFVFCKFARGSMTGASGCWGLLGGRDDQEIYDGEQRGLYGDMSDMSDIYQI